MQNKTIKSQQELSQFKRKFLNQNERLTCIGSGSLGGKAQGLEFINNILISDFNHDDFPNIEVSIPTMTVICTDIFDSFMKRNDLYGIAYSDTPDDRIAHAFQKAELPAEILGDLRALTDQIHTPLAIRSSSMLEDAMFEPFAGIYATKMIPNNQHSTDIRFQKMVEAIKFVYASTFFKKAKNYIKVTNHNTEDEKMAVIIQEVVGKRYNDRFYPEISGVARSYNFYPVGHAKPEDGIVNLALGLGKTIVDGGLSWMYSPAFPKVNPPFGSIGEILKQTQTEFWAINMGKPPAYDPIKETEYLLFANFDDAESDGTLRYTASTYDAQSDIISPGISIQGPRIINFPMMLVYNEIHLNNLIKSVLSLCKESLEAPVEIEFAMTLNPHRFGFLQVRPMVVSDEKVEISHTELTDENILIYSESVMGNGIINKIQDIVYVKRKNFEAKYTQQIVRDLEKINKKIIADGRNYLLVGYGRWGSSDPWGGIPVNWEQISGAKVIIETIHPNMNEELSQGSHFFHNLTSFKVSYFSVPYSKTNNINFDWLEDQEPIEDTKFVRHIKLSSPLRIKVDGRRGRGVICTQ